MILNSNKIFFLSTIKEKIINFICDKFNIADYPNLHDFIDVKQLDIVNVYDEDILYKIKIRLKRHGEVTINNLEEYREVIESVVERPIKFEIVDYKNIYIDVLYSDKEKEGENIMVENISKYEYIPATDFEKNIDLNKIKYTFIEGEKEGVKANIGYDMKGNLKTFDILEGHAMVGGASRWGKSSFLNIFITNIMLTYTPNEVMFLGCDYKKSDIYYFRKYKHFRGMSTNKKEFIEQVNGLEQEIDKRSKILEEANCRNVINYNKKNDKKLSYIIYVIDELVQLTLDKQCSSILHGLMSKCASYGIYVILASQDFTKDSVGKCKMNCSQVVGFHTQDETDSITLIGKEHDLHKINVKGRCKIKNSEGINEVQIMYIDEDEMEEILKDNIK
jgi:hypothetical protein